MPKKFWDDEAGAVRIDALVKSYLELERKLGSGRREPEPDPEALPPLEVETMPEPPPPAEPEAWAIASPHPLIEPDGELNELLRSAGFSQTQAQLVYGGISRTSTCAPISTPAPTATSRSRQKCGPTCAGSV